MNEPLLALGSAGPLMPCAESVPCLGEGGFPVWSNVASDAPEERLQPGPRTSPCERADGRVVPGHASAANGLAPFAASLLLPDSDVDAMPDDPAALKHVIRDLQFHNSLVDALVECHGGYGVLFDEV